MPSIKKKNTKKVAKAKGSLFKGRTVVVTGKLENFTRGTINTKIESLGALAGSSVSKNTDYLVCGEKAGRYK